MLKGKPKLSRSEKTESGRNDEHQLQLSVFHPFTTLGQSPSIQCKSKPFLSLFQYLLRHHFGLVRPQLVHSSYYHLLEPRRIYGQLAHRSKDCQLRTAYHRGRGGLRWCSFSYGEVLKNQWWGTRLPILTANWVQTPFPGASRLRSQNRRTDVGKSRQQVQPPSYACPKEKCARLPEERRRR